MIYLHKLLPVLVSPLFISLALLIFFILTRRRRYGIMAAAIIYIAAMPITGNNLVQYLEKDQHFQSLDTLPKADAVVVLSGMMRRIPTEDGMVMEWNDAVDRIFAGIDTMKADKAPVLILTRGILPWQKGVPEGDILADTAKQAGIPTSRIHLTDIVANTAEEAAAIKTMLAPSEPTIILITSAFHMPRARQIFEGNGFNVIPHAVDFRASDGSFSVMKFIPQASGLNQTSFAIRELIGRLWYLIRY